MSPLISLSLEDNCRTACWWVILQIVSVCVFGCDKVCFISWPLVSCLLDTTNASPLGLEPIFNWPTLCCPILSTCPLPGVLQAKGLEKFALLSQAKCPLPTDDHLMINWEHSLFGTAWLSLSNHCLSIYFEAKGVEVSMATEGRRRRVKRPFAMGLSLSPLSCSGAITVVCKYPVLFANWPLPFSLLLCSSLTSLWRTSASGTVQGVTGNCQSTSLRPI